MSLYGYSEYLDRVRISERFIRSRTKTFLKASARSAKLNNAPGITGFARKLYFKLFAGRGAAMQQRAANDLEKSQGVLWSLRLERRQLERDMAVGMLTKDMSGGVKKIRAAIIKPLAGHGSASIMRNIVATKFAERKAFLSEPKGAVETPANQASNS